MESDEGSLRYPCNPCQRGRVCGFRTSALPQPSDNHVVPLPSGGFADTLPRLVGDKLSQRWDQPVVIVNEPGAAVNIGAELVSHAMPDGYTLLATPAGSPATNRFVFKKLPFDPDAFVPVTVLARGPFILVARHGLPVSNLKELIAYAKANPGKLTYASSRNGSPPQLAMDLLAQQAGIRLLHVPFKGLAPGPQRGHGGTGRPHVSWIGLAAECEDGISSSQLSGRQWHGRPRHATSS